jgi:hypothetical protein
MSIQTTAAEKILRRFKGLRQHLQAGEAPLFTVPAIWDGGQESHSAACDVILTNQRIFGYIYMTFPRERLFLDALPLASIRAVSLREKSFEPLFRELLVRGDGRKVYIRAPRQKIESLQDALRSAIAQHTSEAQQSFIDRADTSPETTSQLQDAVTPIYARQEMRGTFERSPLAIIMLFVGGLLLEIVGAITWLVSQSAQAGLPLCVAGFVAVVTSILLLRSRRM